MTVICNSCGRNESEVKIRKSGLCTKCKSKIDYEKNKENKLDKCREYHQKNKEVRNKNAKEYYEKNKEVISQKNELYRKENSEIIREREIRFRSENKEKCRDRGKNYREKNKDKERDRRKKYYNENKEKEKSKNREYYEKNKYEINEKRISKSKDKSKSDKVYKLKLLISSSIRSAFNHKGYRKSSRTEKILGCSFYELKIHLESKFEKWMNWENQGAYNGEINYGWDIDHIIPISSAESEEDIIRLNHFTNLQPLCSQINRYIKRDSMNYYPDRELADPNYSLTKSDPEV